MQKEQQIPVWAAIGAGIMGAGLLLLAMAGWDCFRFPVEPAVRLGVDLRMMLRYSRAWLATGNPYLALNPYPPLAAVVYAPLTVLPFPVSFMLQTVLTVAAFVSVTLVLPLRIFPRADRAAVWMVTLAGLCSYGLQFELRWGQFNVLAMALAAWGIYLFHRGKGTGSRMAAYALFSLAIQLKVYPAIWVFAFAKDARAWKENLMRWAGLGALNIALLFMMGPGVFTDFLHSLKAQAAAPYVWAGNHSLQSFAEWSGQPALAPVFGGVWAVCFAWVLVQSVRHQDRSAFAGLVLMGALGAMLLPGVSHDYKLTAFPLAFSFFIAVAGPSSIRTRRGKSAFAWLAILAFLYGWTLFPFPAKPLCLQNNAPFLLAAAVGTAVWLGLAGLPKKAL